MPEAGLDDSPFRVGAEPWRDPRPDGLEDMRRAYVRKNRLRANAILVPVGSFMFVALAYLLATSLIGIADGVPLGSRQPVSLVGVALLLAAIVFVAWRMLSRRWTIGLVVVGVVAAGVWTGFDTLHRRQARAEEAQLACRERHVSEAEWSACIAEETACVASLESGLDEPSVLYTGDACLVSDPRR